MHHPTVQVDVVGLAGVEEDFLGPVALLQWENDVDFGRSDAQVDKGPVMAESEVILVDQRGMGKIAGLDFALVVADNVL